MITLTANDLYYLKKAIKEKYGHVVRFTIDFTHKHIDIWTDEGLSFYIDLERNSLSMWDDLGERWTIIGNSKKITS